MDDTVFWCRRENTTTRPEPETEDSGTLTSTDDNIFADFFGSYWITKGRPNEWFTSRWPVKSSRSFYVSDWFEMVLYDIEQCNRMRFHDLKYSGVSAQQANAPGASLWMSTVFGKTLAGLYLTRDNTASIITTQVESSLIWKTIKLNEAAADGRIH